MTEAQDGGFEPSPTHQKGGAESGENLIDLVRQLTQQGSHLAEQQLNLLRVELRESVDETKAAAGIISAAAVVGIAGLGVTLMGVAYLLGDAIDNHALATLIVGILTLIVAFVLYSSGSKKIRNNSLTPDRSIRTIERASDAALGNLTQDEQK